MKLSNRFTIVRVIFAPFFFLLYFIPIWTGKFAITSMIIAIPCLIFAELTDYFDGHYARKHKEVSDFGKLFDPFADVILHLTSFACFMRSYDSANCYIPIFAFIMIMLREYAQNFLRMIAVTKGVAIAARKGGKFKTVMYVVLEFYALFLEALVRTNLIPPCFEQMKIGAVCLAIVCVICSYASFADYLYHFGKLLKRPQS